MNLPPFLEDRPEGACLSVKVQPRASRDEVGEAQGNHLKIRVTAPPVDSAANEALRRLLAGILGCPRNAVQLLRGATARHKQLLVQGWKAADVAARLEESRRLPKK